MVDRNDRFHRRPCSRAGYLRRFVVAIELRSIVVWTFYEHAGCPYSRRVSEETGVKRDQEMDLRPNMTLEE